MLLFCLILKMLFQGMDFMTGKVMIILPRDKVSPSRPALLASRTSALNGTSGPDFRSLAPCMVAAWLLHGCWVKFPGRMQHWRRNLGQGCWGGFRVEKRDRFVLWLLKIILSMGQEQGGSQREQMVRNMSGCLQNDRSHPRKAFGRKRLCHLCPLKSPSTHLCTRREPG